MKDLANNNETPFERVSRKLSLIVLLGGLFTGINHFIGYSFLKGRINSLGLGSPDLQLSLPETSFQTMSAMWQLLILFTQFLQWLSSLNWHHHLFIVVAVGLMAFFFLHKSPKSTDTPFDRAVKRMPKWLWRLFSYPIGGSIFMYYVVTTMFFLIFFVTLFVSIGYLLGNSQGDEEVRGKICKEVSKGAKEIGYAACNQFSDADGNIYFGRLVFMNKTMIIMTTNTESIIFDSKRNMLFCSPKVGGKAENNPSKHQCFTNRKTD